MKTFNEFREYVYKIAEIKFEYFTKEVKQRLDVELAAIEKYDSTAVLVCILSIFDKLSENNIYSQLSIHNEYGVSLVCYVLGISLFNPLDHPTLDTESIAVVAFRYCPTFDFSIDSNAYKLIKQWLKEWGYKVEFGTMDNIHTFIIWTKSETDKIIRIDARYCPDSCKLQQTIRTLGDRLFYDIPFDDKETFETIYNLDLYGTTTSSFSSITLDALIFIKPTTLNELAAALSFIKETQYENLINFISEKQIDSTNEFAQYVEAHNLYKLTYIKKHYPECFDSVLTYK